MESIKNNTKNIMPKEILRSRYRSSYKCLAPLHGEIEKLWVSVKIVDWVR